ncbi:hypothetical protein [Paenibacillus contaminans]|uniref:Uncharacterized protein n=1 Tax=Paenibacillus contaminans TaxID=450362 RepID=A0A329MFV5_9BACL|nr:hypothetical protein [Paenibacillus contaminans]RAV18805.1 hypothetical protein DQG23_24045 [Paenibacillus contaminans]
MNISDIEQAIGRELTDSERKTIEWLNGWERETKLNFMAIVRAAKENGFIQGVRFKYSVGGR